MEHFAPSQMPKNGPFGAREIKENYTFACDKAQDQSNVPVSPFSLFFFPFFTVLI